MTRRMPQHAAPQAGEAGLHLEGGAETGKKDLRWTFMTSNWARQHSPSEILATHHCLVSCFYVLSMEHRACKATFREAVKVAVVCCSCQGFPCGHIQFDVPQ